MMSHVDATTGHDNRDLSHDAKDLTHRACRYPHMLVSTMLNIDDLELYRSSSNRCVSALSQTMSLTEHRPSLLLAAALPLPWPGTP